MTGIRISQNLSRRLLLPLVLLLGLGFAHAAQAAATSDGPWRLRIDLSSFFDGHIGTVERVLELHNGQWEGTIREGQTLIGLRVAVAGGRIDGLMAVTPDSGWNSVSVRFSGLVVNDVVERQLWGPATYRGFGSFGKAGPRQRDVDINFRLERL